MKDRAAADASDVRTDERLVARWKAGDARAFDELVDLHIARVFALAVELLGRREDAQEVTQEVLLKLHRYLPRLQDPGSLRPWLYRVCVNQCNDWRRLRRHDPVPLGLESARDREGVDPAAAAEQLVYRQAVRAALTRLPERQRLAFVLCHLAGLSVNEIAATLQCAPATVRVHLSRAVGRLRATLAQEVGSDG